MKKLSAFCAGWLVCASVTSASDGRIEISQSMVPYTITNAGSYVVTENLTGSGGANGIVIAASHVTLDMNGFQLAGTGTDNGIFAANRQNIRIVNGIVRGWGKGIGMLSCSNVALSGVIVSQSTFEGAEVGPGSMVDDCTIFQNGGRGLEVGEACVVTRCVVRDNSSVGIMATNGACVISLCAIRENGNDGIRSGPATVIVACTSRSNSGDGFDVGSGSQVSDSVGYQNDDGFRSVNSAANFVNCVAFNNRLYGFTLGDGGAVAQSVANENLIGGVYAASNSFIQQVVAFQNISNGFFVAGAANRLEQNHTGQNNIGYDVEFTNNLIVRNSASANATEYSVVAGNIFGNIVTDANTNGPWVNFNH